MCRRASPSSAICMGCARCADRTSCLFIECRRLRRRSCMGRKVSGCTWGRLRVRRTFACYRRRGTRRKNQLKKSITCSHKYQGKRCPLNGDGPSRGAFLILSDSRRLTINTSCAARLITENRNAHPAATHPPIPSKPSKPSFDGFEAWDYPNMRDM
jgi:hypothetical protein